MTKIRLEIDAELLARVDAAAHELGTDCSAFVRAALEQALRRLKILALEAKHAEGYARWPVETGEFDGWQDEQVWPDP